MVLQLGTIAARLSQLRPRSTRVTFTSTSIKRVAALSNAIQASETAAVFVRPAFRAVIASRTFADKPVSRPKAHTGRTRSTAKKAQSTSRARSLKNSAKQKKVTKGRQKTKPKAKSKRKPKPKRKSTRRAKKTKVLTEQQKERLAIQKLRERALNPPKGSPATAWTVFNAEKVRQDKGNTLVQSVKAASSQFKNFTPEQLEHYNHIANQNKFANEEAYRRWVESYPPDTIYRANLARVALKRHGVKGSKSAKLQDTRLVKRSRSAYTFFLQERVKSGDFKGLVVKESSKLIGREWRALTASERKPYEDVCKQDKLRYIEEFKTVYKRNPGTKAVAAA